MINTRNDHTFLDILVIVECVFRRQEFWLEKG